MAEIVNLRQARKARGRAEARAKADANAAKHGRGKGEKAKDAAEAAAQIRHLDGHLREREETPRDDAAPGTPEE